MIFNIRKAGIEPIPNLDYKDKLTLPPEEIVNRVLMYKSQYHYPAETFPAFRCSFGCDEAAVFCNPEADFKFTENSFGTNWIEHYVEDWTDWQDFSVRKDHSLYQRMLEIYRAAAKALKGKMLMQQIDLHTNLGLLAAMRGSEHLCMDLVMTPELIDGAMQSARRVFDTLWDDITEAGRFDELGYFSQFASTEGACVLQCDFSCMIGPDMFNRWVMPFLEEEASRAKHAYYHWDGVEALTHKDSLLASNGLHTLGFLPGHGKGRQIEFLELHKECQAAGKAVHVGGTPDECRAMHRELNPALTIYTPFVDTIEEANELIEWFNHNT